MGENKPYFSIFPLQTEANSSDLLSRPPGLAVMEALACSLPPSQVVWSCGWQKFMAKARAAMFFPNLFILFFPHGCSPHTGVELGEAEVVFLSISISQEHREEDRQGTQSVIYQGYMLLYLLSQLQHTHRQLKLHTVVKAQTALPLTL